MILLLALASLTTWVWLLLFHGRFWQGGPVIDPRRKPGAAPDVAVIVPARNEIGSIKPCLQSLLEQDYAGRYRVILVNDESTDGTEILARSLPDPHRRLTVLEGRRHPAGWSGKLWAVFQGEQEALKDIGPEGYILLTDADIVHAPEHLSALVAKAQEDGLDMVSEMVTLNCETFFERALVPAFVYFFALLYPFRKIADPSSPVAGAAGGTILLRQEALVRIGGVQSLRGALIDDCTLAAHVKRSGGKLYLGDSRQAWSIRTYDGPGEIWRMIARTAYVQLRYSPLRLLMAMTGMALVWLFPVALALLAKGRARQAGLLAYLLGCLSFVPALKRFNLSFVRVLPLPLVAGFYMLATIDSAVSHYRGVGVRWKERSYTVDAA